MDALQWHKPHERSIQCILYSRCLAGYSPLGRGFFRSRGEIAERLRKPYLGISSCLPIIRGRSLVHSKRVARASLRANLNLHGHAAAGAERFANAGENSDAKIVSLPNSISGPRGGV